MEFCGELPKCTYIIISHKICSFSVLLFDEKTYTRKVPKFSDTRNLCCNLPKIQTKRQNLRVSGQKDANRKANSEDPDHTAPLDCSSRSSLIWVCTVCPDLYVQKLRIITVPVHNHTTEFCIILPVCEAPGTPIDGKITVSDDGMTVQYGCEVGFTLRGTETQHCQSGGAGWDESSPSCSKLYELCHEKTCFLHMRKQRHISFTVRSAARFAVPGS